MWELTIAEFTKQADGTTVKTSEKLEGMYANRQDAETKMLDIALKNTNLNIVHMGYLKSPIGTVYFLDPLDRFWQSYPLYQM